MASSRGVLPTRKNRAAKNDAAAMNGYTADVGSDESRQMMSRAGDRQSGGEEARVDYNNNKSSPSSENYDTAKQSFVMDDIPTIDTSTMPSVYDRNSPSRRGASPSIITSRRGRSRSPVGYNNPSGATTSHSSSRNGSSGRPLSRNDISSAAFAAGEAAAGVMDPYARQQSHHPQMMHARARSPSPTNRFPALDLSFEVSPQQSMSFMGDGMSFDWNAGASQQHASATGRRSPSPPQQQHHHHHHNYYGGRSSSPLQTSRAASRNSQALFPEHQILSSRSREYFGTHGGNSNNNNRGERRTIRSPSPNPNRSSVFRGSPSIGSAANRLPAELMLALDDTPPSSPVASSKQKKAMEKKSNQSAAATIDKELSATHDVAFEHIQFDGIMPEGDYLSNLSLRKSYDLEQVFSFMNENKEDSKNSEDPMRLSTASFANFTSTLMCNSNEAGDRARQQHPVIQSIASQNSNIGLTPIHSFNDAQEVDQVDGDELGRFLQNAPIMQDGGPAEAAAGGQYWSYNQASAPAAMHTQTPPSYNNVYSEDTNMNKYPPSSGLAPTLPTLENSSLATTTQSKVSTRHTVHPMVNLSCRSDFFALLRKMAPAFMGFRFTLPEMNQPAPESDEGFKKPGSMYRPNEGQLMVARRRVNSSVCAFGGVIAHRVVSFDTSREEVRIEMEKKRKYDENLSMRYFMKENCVSWDVELHDVIKPSAKKAKVEKSKAAAAVTATPMATVTKDPLSDPYCAPVTPKSPGHSSDNSSNSKIKDSEKKGKTKYRCKLCGLPKQNHTCAYKKNVVRSIGTQVYPVVNAFVSNEPGLLAPALTEMNNFTSMLSHDTSAAPAGHVYRMPYSGYNGPITPDSHWSPTTPGGLSTMSSTCDPGTPRTPNSPYNNNNFRKRDYSIMSRTMTHTSTPGGYSPRQSRPEDSMFRDTMQITMEQFRTVRVNAAEKVLQPYQYPLVPTPYDQRKEMGDTLFALSKEVPSLADSCASILREARERDEWDQAVAELTTQVLVVLKCEEEDYSLEGLMRHLNGLGIAC
ncbi:hypothetical protein ACHAWT_005278 [Skeletonema menzelii]